MTANPPHVPGPGETDGADDTTRSGTLSRGTSGILAVTMAALALGLAGAVIAAVVSELW